MRQLRPLGDHERCTYDVDNSPFDNRCLRKSTMGNLCSQHGKMIAGLLSEVEKSNVTWNQPGMKERTFRLWADENNYKLVTRKMKWCVRLGLVKCVMASGYQYISRGYCVLTSVGRQSLKGAGE